MNQPKLPRIRSRRAIAEFCRIVWHLRAIFGTLAVLFLLLTAIMYAFGGAADLLTHARASLGEVAYMCAVTALTIGYGDVVPTTPLGRFVAVALGLLGVLATGLVTAVAVYAVQRAAGRAPLNGE